MRTGGHLIWLCCASAIAVLGCQAKHEAPAAKSPEIRVPPAQAAVIGKSLELKQQHSQERKTAENSPTNPPKASRQEESKQPQRQHVMLAAADSPEKQPPAGAGKFKFEVPQAVDAIAAEIRDALGLRKTLVVVLVEQTAAASPLADAFTEQLNHVVQEIAAEQPGQLEMAVLGYSNNVNFLTPEATANADQIEKALSAAKAVKGDKANVFAAFKQAEQKFLPYQARGYEIIFVVAGVSTGDDLNLADEVILPLRRAAIEVYGVGPALPFGGPRIVKNARAAAAANSEPRQFESLWPERIQLALSGNQNTADLIDAGYGPFGLERICRLTDGKFFRVRKIKPPGWNVDPTAGDVKSDLLLKYAPDYVDEDRYEKLLAGNKCRQALHNAALLPPAEGLGQATTDFPKQKDEAALAKMITNAQKAAAIDDQPLQRLYDALVAGEADRPKLTGARWQAGYDLAMGLVLAAKARLDGYNAMLAVIKQGKTFANADSTHWVLEPADENAVASTIDKMVKKSRTYLKRVIDEHPGTPWAAVAERELRYHAGWKLIEK
jgi:hypothetical protein